MAVEDNRISHLRSIVDAHAADAGGKLRAGYRAVSTATGLGEEYIYQLYKGVKPVIGPDAARAIARVYANGRSDDWFDRPLDDSIPIPSPHGTTPIEESGLTIPQFDTGGKMGHGLVLQNQPGVIKSWTVTHDWVQQNVHRITSPANLSIVTGFGDSMRPLYNPGDPLLVDQGIVRADTDGVYFFRVGEEGFVKRLQRIPTLDGVIIRAKSENPRYDPFDIVKGMDFQVFGRVVKVWRGEDF